MLFEQKFDTKKITYVGCNNTSYNKSNQANYVIDTTIFFTNQPLLIGIILDSMTFLLFEIKNEFKLCQLAKIPSPGFELASFGFINDYAIMCFKENNILGILDLNDLNTINITQFMRKRNLNLKIIDELKHACLFLDSHSECLFLINANESSMHYLKLVIEINGKFTNGKIMKTFYEINSSLWQSRICAVSQNGLISIFDTCSDLSDPNLFSLLKIAQLKAHFDDITFVFIKGKNPSLFLLINLPFSVIQNLTNIPGTKNGVFRYINK